MTFNIIYTPASVKYLLFFVNSLLDYSNYRFRLVSNGCLYKEQQLLKIFCQKHDRLEYWAIPGKQMISHGQALHYLQTMTTEKYFCFMDSDIFATQPLPNLELLLSANTGIFSALPIWVKQSEMLIPNDFKNLVGTFNQTDEGICTGSTYFAIYHNQKLREMMQNTGFGFDEAKWNELPSIIQTWLNGAGLKKKSYDTGKVLNLLLGLDDCRLSNFDIPELCHIGGTSFEITYQTQKTHTTGLGQVVRNQIKQTVIVHKAIQWRKEKEFMKRYKDAPETEYLLNKEQRIKHRTPIRKYFIHLYDALIRSVDLPHLPNIENSEIHNKLLIAKENYISTFHKYHQSIQSID